VETTHVNVTVFRVGFVRFLVARRAVHVSAYPLAGFFVELPCAAPLWILRLSRTIKGMSIETKSDLLALVANQHHQLQRFGVKRLGVFGSWARNEQHNASDVDVLIEFELGHKTFDNFMHQAFYLEELLGRRVDLLTPESLSPHLGPHILREVEYVSLHP
jgi:hypothetical protein